MVRLATEVSERKMKIILILTLLILTDERTLFLKEMSKETQMQQNSKSFQY